MLVLALVTAACGPSATDNGQSSTTSSSSTTTSTSSTPTTSPGGTVTTAPADTTTTTGASDQATVAAYFFMDDTGVIGRPGPFLVPVARNVPGSLDPVEASLGELFKGPTEAEVGSVPAITTTIPDNTLLLSMTFTDGIATVDLSREFESGGGSFSMFGRLAQVVFTLTQFPEIDSVVFELDGEPVTVFSTEGILIEAPVTRDDYLDLVPGILVDSPAYGGTLDNPAHITGSAAVFEAVFRVVIADQDGLILSDTQVMTDNGMGWGAFETTIPYEVDEPQRGSLIVWENSAKDGSQINVREYPVTLTPSS
jgi:spore germination protein GerM